MTIIAAAYDEETNAYAISADSRTLTGETGIVNTPSVKVVELPRGQGHFGFAGTVGAGQCVRDMAEDWWRDEVHTDVLTCARDVRYWARECLVPCLTAARKFVDSRDSSRIIVTCLLASPHGLYTIGPDGAVSQYATFVAIGSGKAYAMGAMRVMYSGIPYGGLSRALPEITRRACEIASEFDSGCGGQVLNYGTHVVEEE